MYINLQHFVTERDIDVIDTPVAVSRRPYIYKWKNHFYEMKGDVGMSLHEKERNKKMPTQDTKSLITPSLHLCFALTLFVMNALGKANSTTS